MRHIAIATVLLAACGGTPSGEPGDPARFDGAWQIGSRECALTGPGVTCALPSWSDAGRPMGIARDVDIDTGVARWIDAQGAVVATHAGTVHGDCLAVPAGFDDGLARDAYSMCLQAEDAELVGAITWAAGTQGQCTCTVTLRAQ